jgi:hypothetical protein
MTTYQRILRGYARACEHKGDSYDRLATRAAVADGARRFALAEGQTWLAWDLEGEVSGYYDLMRKVPQ